MRTARIALLSGLTGCFAEVAGGVTPRMHQEVTDFADFSQTTTDLQWTVALWLGFHIDYRRVGVGYSPVNFTGHRAPSDRPGVVTAGQHFRIDVDVPLTHAVRTRATASYTTVGSATIDATNLMTAAASPEQPNGNVKAPSAHGRGVFAGLSLASQNHVGLQYAGTFGLSYDSSSSPRYSNPDASIPAVEQSGVGLQVRVMVQWQPDLGFLKYMSNDDLEKVIHNIQIEKPSAPAPSGPSGGTNCTQKTITECEDGQFGRRCTERHVCQ